MAKLVLVRHGQSQWNLENRFTGWVDIPLTEAGKKEALEAGVSLKDIRFDFAFTSVLDRAIETLKLLLQGCNQTQLAYRKDQALNERMYGDLQGMNKAEAAARFGDAQVHIWRRSYDTPPPGGESLKMTAERALPYFEKEIMPLLLLDKNVLVSAHGNSLRALIMVLDKLTSEQILKIEIPNGVPIVYEMKQGEVIQKEIRSRSE